MADDTAQRESRSLPTSGLVQVNLDGAFFFFAPNPVGRSRRITPVSPRFPAPSASDSRASTRLTLSAYVESFAHADRRRSRRPPHRS
jgi:hypothetical protein